MSLSNRIEVHYINVDRRTKATSRDIYIADDMAVDGDKLTFSWLISGNATKYYGRLNFIILFECLDSDGNYTYKWNTEICKLLTIGEGISNTEAVAEDYSDILEKFKNEILGEAAEGTVKFTEQTLTDEEKKQTRTNIGAQEEICSENEEILLSLDIDHNFAGGLNKYTRQLSDDEVHIYDVIINGSTPVLLRSNKLEYTLTPGGFISGYGYLDYNGEHIAYRYSGLTHAADRIYFYPDTEISKNLGDSFTLSNYSLTKIPNKYLPDMSLVVNITQNDDNTYSCDKTNAEIYAAYENGIYIEARCSWDENFVVPLYQVDQSNAAFMIDHKKMPDFGSLSAYEVILIHATHGVSRIVVNNPLIIPPKDTKAGSVWAIDATDGPKWIATANQTNALTDLAELGLITPAQQNGTFYTSPAGEIYTI